MYHHLAHFDEMLIKKGDRVKRGQLIGYVGTTGASTAPHLHYEILKKRPKTWTQYTAGMSRQEVAEAYIDPKRYIDPKNHIPAKSDRFTGYEFLEKLKYKKQYHPGVDINSGKSGWADFRQPVLSPADGEVLFADHDGHNQGWGDHGWIKEDRQEIDVEFAKSLAREKLGFYIAVEQHGELYAVTEDGMAEYIHPDNLMEWLIAHAEGISNKDLNKLPKK